MFYKPAEKVGLKTSKLLIESLLWQFLAKNKNFFKAGQKWQCVIAELFFCARLVTDFSYIVIVFSRYMKQEHATGQRKVWKKPQFLNITNFALSNETLVNHPLYLRDASSQYLQKL